MNHFSLKRKYCQIFLLKLSYKESCVKFDAFKEEMVHFFLKNNELRNESVKLTFKWTIQRYFISYIDVKFIKNYQRQHKYFLT